ncbi:MAG: DUF1493 family protein [Opitutaceae bacterium]|nr:DUF1493 family protein [Opitutaceae bacterium]
MSRRATFEKVADFIVDEVRFDRGRIGYDTSLTKDLGLDGDDAVNFFDGFQQQFGVNLTGIQWKRHFGDEGLDHFLIFWPPFWRDLARKKQIHVRDLVEAVEAGR